MDLANYLSFLGAAILLTLAPGPDNMYILTKSLSAGPRQGVTLAMGLATGPLWHTLLVMAGVAAFIQSSPASFMVLKYCGAAYLLYLSYGAFRSKGASIKAGDVVDKSESFALYKRGFKRGFLMNASNPKVLLFFLAILLSQSSDRSSGPDVLHPGSHPFLNRRHLRRPAEGYPHPS